jgi:hypothetical protein
LLRAGLALSAAAALAVPVSSASAATFGCSASAVQLSLLGHPLLEPAVANAGGAACADDTKVLDDPVAALGAPASLPLAAGAIVASTRLADTKDGPHATATGGVLDLRVAALPALPISLPQVTVPDSLRSVTVDLAPIKQQLIDALPLGALNPLATTVIGPLTSTPLTLDVTPALTGLLPAAGLPALDLLRARTILASAGASCVNGSPALVNGAEVGSLSVLGQEVRVGDVLDRTLVDTGYVDLSQVDVTKIALPPSAQTLLGGLTGALLTSVTGIVDAQIKATLDAIGKVKVLDPTIAHVQITNGAVARDADSVTQQGLGIDVSILGQPVLSGVIGRASVSAAGVDCRSASAPAVSPADPSTPTGATLQCTKRRLVLVDVLERRHGVRLTGVADPRYIGKRVAIVFGATGHVVAHAKVRRDGSFATRAQLPPRRLRGSNRARYVAKLGRERSLNLKLRRRLIVRRMVSRDGRVIITGRVVRPLARPVKPILVRQRLSCHRMKVVQRFRPRRNGHYRVTLQAPRSGGSAVYRLTTKVRDSAHGRALFETFTLPRAVELKR